MRAERAMLLMRSPPKADNRSDTVDCGGGGGGARKTCGKFGICSARQTSRCDNDTELQLLEREREIWRAREATNKIYMPQRESWT